jgi:hypothetical protein
MRAISSWPGRTIGLLAVVILATTRGPAAAGAAEVPPIAIGDTLPALRGELLSGRQVALPDSSLGSVTLLMFGFTYDSRHDVEAWAERFRHDFAADTAVTFFEVPVIGGVGRLARPFIDRGMRRGTPRELHDHVITVYRNAGDWKRRVGYAERDVAYLLLLDTEGRLAFSTRGPLDEDGYRTLAGHVRRLRP